jgi:hypothetical protein
MIIIYENGEQRIIEEPVKIYDNGQVVIVDTPTQETQ